MRRGLTFRSFFVCIFALLLMGMWSEYHTCYLGAGGDALLENTPPNGAVTTPGLSLNSQPLGCPVGVVVP